ncbi:tetratricopeptide repeat protein [Streptomyces sp. NPDC058417]|uniref:tetratricopeptide repeat protein n=1 Tax=unclassified Streptomyces TaxID=2593676 RepID=UPI00365D3403
MEPSPSSRPEALHAALLALSADPASAAWDDLARVVVVAIRADPAVAALWPADGAAQRLAPPLCRPLARALGRAGAHDEATDRAVTEWLDRHAPPPVPVPSAPTSNVLQGDAVVHGPSVQARDIHGGLHFHAPTGTARPELPVPRQLPPASARFVGRVEDRRVLDRLRARSAAHVSPVLVVTGLAGVGKTALVTHWLHEHAGDFPDGFLYADLGVPSEDDRAATGPVPPGTVLEAFLMALGAHSVPVGTARRSALWRSITAELRLAVLLDNASTAAQVRPLLLGTATGLTVVTSRNSLTGLRADGASVHRLEGLPSAAAIELLSHGGGDRVAREPDAAREVIRLCGHLPLAVGLASAQLAVRPHRSVSSLAGSLSHGHGAVDSLRVDGEAVLRTALDLSYDLLPDDGALLYRVMGLLPTDRHDLPMLTAVLAGPRPAADTVHEIDATVQSLVEANLLDETGPGTYRLHDLVRPHARRIGEEREEHGRRERALRRFVDWCLSHSAAAESILAPSHRLPGHDLPPEALGPVPFTGADEALAWLDAHRGGVMGAVRHCARAGWHTECWRLTDLAWPLFLRLRPTDMWIEAHRLGLDAARLSGSRPGEGRMLTSGAIGLRNAGRYREAADWYRQALDMARSDGDTRQQAQAVNGLGHISLLTGRLDEARQQFEHALRLRESIGYTRGAALSRRRLGETALASGDFVTAVRHLRQAGAELRSLDETYEETRVLALLGHVLDRAGDHDEGVRRLRRALTAFREGRARSEHWEGRCLEWLGQAAESRGDTREAADCYEAARVLFERLDPSDAQRVRERLRRL